jgi:hypothetical protein
MTAVQVQIKRAHYAIEDRATKPSNLLKAALWYAKHGYYVFPCWPGTKKPATDHGLNDATTDLDQVRRWWSENPTYNIGIHCGASGLLTLDLDTYKANAENLSIALPSNTVTVISAHHGTHLWYRMPIGKTYGNSRGTLPKWCDIRGFGGYVVAPPSVLIEDGVELPYTFAPDHKPTDIAIADLPANIAIVLDAAQATRDAVPVNFTDGPVALPDLAQWPLSDTTLELIHNSAPIGSDRSAHDQKTITALICAGATDDDIRAVFVHFAIGEKYKEKGSNGDKYLAYSIGKARTWLADHDSDSPEARKTVQQLVELRSWAQSAEFAARVTDEEDKGIRRIAEYEKTLIGLINYAIKKRSSRVLIGCRQLGELINSSHMTAKRHLAMFGEGITANHKDGTVTHRPGLNLLTVTDDPDGFGKWVDFSDLLHSVTPLHIDIENGGCNTLQQFADDHLQDDAYVLYPRRFAVRYRPNAEILSRGLGASALFIAAQLDTHGEMTRKEISESTGLSPYTVGAVLRRMADMGLLVVWDGYPYRYELHPDYENRIDDLRPLLPSYGIGQLRCYRNAKARVMHAEAALDVKNPAPDREKVAYLRRRIHRATALRDAYRTSLESMGLDLDMRVAEEVLGSMSLEELDDAQPAGRGSNSRPTVLKIDCAEEWNTWGYKMWQRVLRLKTRGCTVQDAARLLTHQMTLAEVGEDADADTYKRVFTNIGDRVDLAVRLAYRRNSAARQFAGVGRQIAA